MGATLLSINNYHYARGGAEVVFLQHNEMLAAAGWSVVPFCMVHENNDPTPWSSEFVEEIELNRDGEGIIERARKGVKAIYSIESRRKIARLIDRVSPDLCHAHNIYHHISPSILAVIRSRGVPLVMTLHDLKLACPAYSMLTHDGVCERCRGGRLFRVATNRCMKGSTALSVVVMIESYLHRFLRSYAANVDRYIVPSRFYLNKFVEWGLDRSKFDYVPNFVDVDKVVPRFEPGRRFVYVGRLSPEKGVATLVEAAAAAGVPVDIVGTGPLDQPLRARAARAGGDVRFHGYLRGSALSDVVARARAVVVPSEWYENAPLTVLEAGALGKPIIVSEIGGLPELVDEESGWTFLPGSVEVLAERLREVAALSNAAVKAAGVAARRRVAGAFSSQRYFDRVREIYERVGVPWQ